MQYIQLGKALFIYDVSQKKMRDPNPPLPPLSYRNLKSITLEMERTRDYGLYREAVSLERSFYRGEFLARK
jgi:hypothetical protein